jgi:hypothetical protein
MAGYELHFCRSITFQKSENSPAIIFKTKILNSILAYFLDVKKNKFYKKSLNKKTLKHLVLQNHKKETIKKITKNPVFMLF